MHKVSSQTSRHLFEPIACQSMENLAHSPSFHNHFMCPNAVSGLQLTSSSYKTWTLGTQNLRFWQNMSVSCITFKAIITAKGFHWDVCSALSSLDCWPTLNVECAGLQQVYYKCKEYTTKRSWVRHQSLPQVTVRHHCGLEGKKTHSSSWGEGT